MRLRDLVDGGKDGMQMSLHRSNRLFCIMLGNCIGDSAMLCKDPAQPFGIFERQMTHAINLCLGILDGFQTVGCPAMPISVA